MSFELYYTSAERGLKPHSRGFCTVARTEGLAGPVIERLESLSSYQPVIASGSEQGGRNPVRYAHWRIPVGARQRSVLSRVAFVRSDHTGRSSMFAHHVLLEPAEQSVAGPAAMLLREGVMQSKWDGEPRLLAPRKLPEMEGIEREEKAPAWCERLAEAFRSEPEKPAYVIFPLGTDILPLLNQAILLLPVTLRWQVTFSTYFTDLPAGLSCAWRCVIAGAPAENAARSSKGLIEEIDRTMGTHGH
jgi:hypothetical protein